MNEAYAKLAEDLCAALGRACSAPVLAKLLSVFESMDIEAYRRLVHERFNGGFILVPARCPDNVDRDLWAHYQRALRAVRRGEITAEGGDT